MCHVHVTMDVRYRINRFLAFSACGAPKEDVEALAARVQEVEALAARVQEVEALAARVQQLEEQVTNLQQADKDILGEWSRSVYRAQRTDGLYQAVQAIDKPSEPGAQLHRALLRIANTAMFATVSSRSMGRDRIDQLEAVNNCLEYLLALRNDPKPCGMYKIIE